jgi:hypothetical protein
VLFGRAHKLETVYCLLFLRSRGAFPPPGCRSSEDAGTRGCGFSSPDGLG